MIKRLRIAQRVAASYLKDNIRGNKTSSSDMETAFDRYDALSEAMAAEPEIMSAVIEGMINRGSLTYKDNAFYYRDTLRLASQRSADNKHKKSIVLMKFLSNLAKKLGVGKHVYVVGGAVRNYVLNVPIKDIDVVIDSVALRGKDSDWFASQLDRAIPVKTSFTTNQYGVAILTVNETWVIDGVDLGGEVIEIANARKESYGGESGKGYKPHAVAPATIEEDLARREFTMNTLLWQLAELAGGPDKAEIIDITGCGLRDLKDGVLRCPSDPDKTFSDDPTRLIRAVKFFIKYGFRIDPVVKKAIRRNAKKLMKAPSNAISDLLINDVLKMQQSKKTLEALDDLGLLDVIATMVKKDASFRATLIHWASRDADVLFLFDMMDMGLPLGKRFGFLDNKQMERLRIIALSMSNKEASDFVDLLKQPGRTMDTKALISELGLQGPEIKTLMEVARTVLLDIPELRNNPRALTNSVRLQYPAITT